MDRLLLEVIAPVLTDLRHCRHCELLLGQTGVGGRVHDAILEQYPEEVRADVANLSAWLDDLAQRYGAVLDIRLIDAQSALGFLKSVRHWVRSYPAFIIEGRKAYVGWDRETLEAIIALHVERRLTAGQPGERSWPLRGEHPGQDLS